MGKIFKEALELGKNEISMPDHLEILGVGTDGAGKPAVYFIDNPDCKKSPCIFYVAYTGHDCPKGYFLGTVRSPQGLVFHIFIHDPELQAGD